MSISIFQKARITCSAAKDVKGSYGVYLKAMSGRNGDIALKLSAFMSQLVIAYSNRITRKLTHTRRLRKLYIKILEQCDYLDAKIQKQEGRRKALTEKISELDTKIGAMQSELLSLESAWDSGSEKGYLRPVGGVNTVGGLKRRMDELRNEIESQGSERSQLLEKLDGIKEDLNTQLQESYDQLGALVVSYRDQISHLYQNLEAFANMQDELLVYYWHKLCDGLKEEQKLATYTQSLSFSEICKLRDVQLIEKRNVFPDEREEINKRISRYANFEIKV